DVRMSGFQSDPVPQVYLSYLNTTQPNMLLSVRPRPGVSNVFPFVRNAIRSADPDQPVFHVKSMEQVLYDSIAGPRLLAALSGIFAFVGVALVSTGLYGAISYLVARRVPEIAIRMALGARAPDVLKL